MKEWLKCEVCDGKGCWFCGSKGIKPLKTMDEDAEDIVDAVCEVCTTHTIRNANPPYNIIAITNRASAMATLILALEFGLILDEEEYLFYKEIGVME